MQARRVRLVVMFAIVLTATITPAVAADSSEPPPVVRGEVYHRGTQRSVDEFVQGLLSGRPQTLPFTGADVTLLTVVGVAAVGIGAGLARGARRGRG